MDDARSALLGLAREDLPARAAAEPGWPVRFDHCFLRIVYDNAVGGRWTDAVARPASKHLSDAQVEAATAHARAMLDGGPDVAHALNESSLAWRRAAPACEAPRPDRPS